MGRVIANLQPFAIMRNPEVRRSMAAEAKGFVTTGQLEKAILLQSLVLAACNRYLTADDVETLAAMTDIARSLERLGDVVEARRLEAEVLNLSRRKLKRS
jgi:hypothetical protein